MFSAYGRGKEIIDEALNAIIITVVISVYRKCIESTKTIIFSTGLRKNFNALL